MKKRSQLRAVLLFLLFALLLQAAELGHFLFIAALETGFLELQALELLFVLEKGAELDQACAGGRMLAAIVLVFSPALGVNCHFETGDALQTPLGVGERWTSCCSRSPAG